MTEASGDREGRQPVYLIINADDFGASDGINRGILELHQLGVVTSTSMMVTGRMRDDAASIAREHPALSVGLHWDVWGEDERTFDLHDLNAVRDELHRQLDAFEALTGQLPSHLDSHRHAHMRRGVTEIFFQLGEALAIPVRGDGQVRHVSDFYAQWEWMVTELSHVSVEALQNVVREKVGPGWTELACHPGHVSADFHSIYLSEREAERETLSDPAVKVVLAEVGVELASYWDWSSWRGTAATATAGDDGGP